MFFSSLLFSLVLHMMLAGLLSAVFNDLLSIHHHDPRPIFITAYFKEKIDYGGAKKLSAHKPLAVTPAPKAALFKKAKARVSDQKRDDSDVVDFVQKATPSHVDRQFGSGVGARGAPQLLNGAQVAIPYPQQAKQMMIEGVVHLRLTISESGKVVKVKIMSGPRFGLRKAALGVAKKLSFLPAVDAQGKAIVATIDHEVVFKLHRQL